MDTFDNFSRYIAPAVIIAAAVVVGLILERVGLRRLKKAAERTKWQGDDVIIGSLRGMILLWIVLLAISSVVTGFELRPSATSLINKAVVALFILSLTLVVARMVVGFLRLYSARATGALPSVSIFVNIARVVVFLVGSLIILDSLGISITPILTALGVGGLAVALALQDTLSNLFAGLHILASRQIQPGNYVKLDTGETGYVIDITWRTTMIRTLPNNYVVVPNSKLASAIVVNYYLPETEMAVLVEVGVGYSSDLAKVEAVTLDVAKDVMNTVTGGVSTFQPFIRYHTFGDSGILFTVILRGKEYVDQYLVKHEFIKRLHKRYAQEGIEIPFPQRDVHVRDVVSVPVATIGKTNSAIR